jgi:clusterin-associated protein 1
MSYREIRNFTEMMQTLGYPRLISMENFRQPNFTLVAEILTWLIQRYDPNSDLVSDIDTEQDRVIFIKSATQLMATKAHVRLNSKKLYGADGYAVKELIKISTLLYAAMNSPSDNTNKDITSAPVNTQLINKKTDLKACRQLASEITNKGSHLFELLNQEVTLREARQRAVSQTVDIDKLEKGIDMCIGAVNDEIELVKSRMENAASDERTLEVKIEKREQELGRKRKRLQSLANVRPAFMDEYEKLEDELRTQYEIYMEKFLNLSFLEQKLEEEKKLDQDMLEQRENSMMEMKAQFQQEINDRTMGVNGGVPESEMKSRFTGNMTGEGIIASDDGSGSLSTSSRNEDGQLPDDDDDDDDEEDDEGRHEFIDEDDDDF